MTSWFDSHCHVEDRQIPGGVDGALAAARRSGVAGFVNVGINVARSRRSIAIAAEHADVWATAGLHPHEADSGDSALEQVAELVAGGGVVGVGETGLDFNRSFSAREAQLHAFRYQTRLAAAHGLALVVHTRDAWDDCFAVLDSCGWPESTIIHCFTGTPVEARRCVDAGAYISFSGLLTYGKEWLRDAARVVPQDRLLVETDSPFLTPEPLRTAKVRRNQPANVALVGEFLAKLRGESVAEIAAATSANTRRAFKLDAELPGQ